MDGKRMLTSVNNLFVNDDALENIFQDVDIGSDPKKNEDSFQEMLLIEMEEMYSQRKSDQGPNSNQYINNSNPNSSDIHFPDQNDRNVSWINIVQ